MNRSCEQRSLRSFVVASALFLVLASPAGAATGFRAERLGSTIGFVTSLAFSPNGTLYYSTTDGDIVRFDDGANTVVAHVPTRSGGDTGLLGVALADDHTAIVHYTTAQVTGEVISRIDLATESETILHVFIDDQTMPSRPVSAEHHGGNPIVTESGSIYVGLGDLASGLIASLPDWNAGKIFRIDPDGTVTQVARGFRNPFDLAWDPEHQRLVLTDNGAAVDDEINIIDSVGGYYGWPFTAGNGPVLPDAIPPIYTFSKVVVPTGIVRLNGSNPWLNRGYLLGAFVGKTIFFIPDIDARPLPDPIPLLDSSYGLVVDVAENAKGDILFATAGYSIYRLSAPLRGDCNGDGRLSAADLDALRSAVSSGTVKTESTGDPWGCDANGDGLISGDDLPALAQLLGLRVRAIRVH